MAWPKGKKNPKSAFVGLSDAQRRILYHLHLKKAMVGARTQSLSTRELTERLYLEEAARRGWFAPAIIDARLCDSTADACRGLEGRGLISGERIRRGKGFASTQWTLLVALPPDML